jgi:hypothetical protein
LVINNRQFPQNSSLNAIALCDRKILFFGRYELKPEKQLTVKISRLLLRYLQEIRYITFYEIRTLNTLSLLWWQKFTRYLDDYERSARSKEQVTGGRNSWSSIHKVAPNDVKQTPVLCTTGLTWYIFDLSLKVHQTRKNITIATPCILLWKYSQIMETNEETQ